MKYLIYALAFFGGGITTLLFERTGFRSITYWAVLFFVNISFLIAFEIYEKKLKK